jgi:hypothetical protein
MLRGEVMADVDLEAFSVVEAMLGVSKCRCCGTCTLLFDVSEGGGERPRREGPSSWSAMLASS